MPATEAKSEPNPNQISTNDLAGTAADTAAASSENLDQGPISVMPGNGSNSGQLPKGGAATATPANPAYKAPEGATAGAPPMDSIGKAAPAETSVAAPRDDPVIPPLASPAQSVEENRSSMAPAETTGNSSTARIPASAPIEEPTKLPLGNTSTPAEESNTNVPPTESTNKVVEEKASITSPDDLSSVPPLQGTSSTDFGGENGSKVIIDENPTSSPSKEVSATPSNIEGTPTASTEQSTVTMPGAESTAMPSTGYSRFMSPLAAFAPETAVENKAADVTGVNPATETVSNHPTNPQAPQSSVEKPVTISSAYPSTFANSACTTCH